MRHCHELQAFDFCLGPQAILHAEGPLSFATCDSADGHCKPTLKIPCRSVQMKPINLCDQYASIKQARENNSAKQGHLCHVLVSEKSAGGVVC